MAAQLSPLFTWRGAIVQSDLSPSTRLVALALSLHMNERGGSCFPGQDTLARETGLHVKTVRDHLRILRAEGWLVASGESAPGRAREYAAHIPNGTVENGTVLDGTVSQNGTAQNGTQDVRPKPKREANASLLRERAKNPVWDALADIFGEATTETARSRRGKVCRSLTAARASPDEIVRRAKAWPRHFSDATLTEMALEKHWDALGRPPLRAGGG